MDTCIETTTDQEYLDNYYTENGQKALYSRLQTLAKLYTKRPEYPFSAQIFGFPALLIATKTHHEGMMEELAQILGVKEITFEGKK